MICLIFILDSNFMAESETNPKLMRHSLPEFFVTSNYNTVELAYNVPVRESKKGTY